MAQGIADHSLIFDRAAERLGALEPAVEVIEVYPEEFGGIAPTNKRRLDMHQIVAEEADGALNDYSDLLDSVDKDITGVRGLDYDAYVEHFIAFQISLDKSLGIKRTIAPFRERYLQFASQGDTAIETQITTFNTFVDEQIAAANADFEGVEPMTREIWDALGKHLDFK